MDTITAVCRLASSTARRLAGRAVGLLAAASLASVALGAAAQPVRTEHVTAELVARNTGVQPGQQLQIGLRLQHIPHWHTYWRNPGDSGLPTTLAWTLPAGAKAGPIDWPAPQRLPIGPLVNYGYEGDLLLPLRFTAPPDAQPGSSLQLKAEANWLVCNDVCIPESATLTLAVPVLAPGSSPAPGPLAGRFDAAAAEAPAMLTGWRTELQRAGRELQLRLVRSNTTFAAADLPPVHVFPYQEQLLEPARHAVWRTADGYAVQLALAPHATEVPATLRAIAVAQVAPGAATPWGMPQRSAEFTVPITEVAALALPAGAVRLDDPLAGGTSSKPGSKLSILGDNGGRATASAGSSASGAASIGLLAALALALVGGMVLNLMPCVFPVLSIKLLGLAQQADRPAQLRSHALAYGAGVLLSFLVLAGLLLALRAAGGAVGWGFQLQEPGVVFVLALLFFALGLNLMGQFELGNLMPQGLATWRAQRPAVDAFGSGVLAVLAASPCTAPFMGAALGFAVTQPAPLALAVFGVLGLGMALPYMALVLMPGWRHRLPRPGSWMLRLKQALAFPMFATVVWLVWVLGLQAGIDSAAQALLALLGLSALVWLLGVLRQPTLGARLGSAAGAAALAALLAWSWPTTDGRPAQAAATPAAGTAPDVVAMAGANWLPYSDAAVAAQLAQGRTVFVDFTAAWCVSCQVNKRLVLTQPAVVADFDKAQVVRMRADWTRRDAEITAALARLGRNGVPVYALLRPGQEPLLLPEILTAGLVRSALAGL
ncbi:MAG: protein-disulfide reductase DsbD family protein [Aquabacterium sp.]|nr:protein-disulfide reductase DsbD family protein [Aquabacterium sp.]